MFHSPGKISRPDMQGKKWITPNSFKGLCRFLGKVSKLFVNLELWLYITFCGLLNCISELKTLEALETRTRIPWEIKIVLSLIMRYWIPGDAWEIEIVLSLSIDIRFHLAQLTWDSLNFLYTCIHLTVFKIQTRIITI